MGKWFSITLLALITVFCAPQFAPRAYAQQAPSLSGAAQSAMTYCKQQQSQNPNGLIAPLVHCFADANINPGSGEIDATQSGFIPVVAGTFLSAMVQYYLPAVEAMAMMVVIFFAIKIVTGQVDPRKLIKESWVMLFKIAGVFYFLSQAPGIYANILSTIQGFADSISQTAVATVVNSGFCVTPQGANAAGGAGAYSGNLWTAWDCLLNYIFGFSGAAALSAGIISIIVMFLFSKGIGSLIFSVAVYLLLSLIFGVARFVHVYLMAILGLSFIYCFGYIFVPLLLFRGTYDRFEKWMHICIGYMFTPIIMLGFMGMMLVTLDTIWFTGTHSISKAILGASNAPTTPGTDGSDNAFTDAVNKQGNTKTCDLNLLTTFLDSNPKAQSSNAGQTPNNGVDGQQQTSTACGDNSSNNNQANNAANNGQGAGGGEGLLENLGIPGSTYLNNISSTISKLKISVQELDIKKMASAAGSADTGTYTSGVLSAFVTAALIVYIMIALLDYIPTLAADLVASGTSIGGAFRSKMMGEDLLRGKNPGIGSGLAGKIKDMGKS